MGCIKILLYISLILFIIYSMPYILLFVVAIIVINILWKLIKTVSRRIREKKNAEKYKHTFIAPKESEPEMGQYELDRFALECNAQLEKEERKKKYGGYKKENKEEKISKKKTMSDEQALYYAVYCNAYLEHEEEMSQYYNSANENMYAKSYKNNNENEVFETNEKQDENDSNINIKQNDEVSDEEQKQLNEIEDTEILLEKEIFIKESFVQFKYTIKNKIEITVICKDPISAANIYFGFYVKLKEDWIGKFDFSVAVSLNEKMAFVSYEDNTELFGGKENEEAVAGIPIWIDEARNELLSGDQIEFFIGVKQLHIYLEKFIQEIFGFLNQV